MGDVTDVLPDLVARLVDDAGFVSDMARYSESLLTEKFIRRKYGRIDEDSWNRLGESDELVHVIEAEKHRRMRDGSSKRERSQQLILKSPEVLDGIISDSSASPRHRVDAIKTLDSFTTNPADHTPATMDRFVIQINLGADSDGRAIVETYNKSIAIGVDDVDPDDGRGAQKTLADKRWDDDSSDVVAAAAIEHKSHNQKIERADRPIVDRADRSTVEQIHKTVKPVKTAPQARKPVKTGAQKISKSERSPEELALESLMQFED